MSKTDRLLKSMITPKVVPIANDMILPNTSNVHDAARKDRPNSLFDGDHASLTNKGTNTHSQIDDHLALTNEHIDWTAASAGTIHASNYVDNDTTDHTALSNIGTNTHAEIDTHIADTTDAHSVSSDTLTLSNKSIALGSNTLTGTKAQFDTALTDGNFAFSGGAFHDGFSDFVANEHIDWTNATQDLDTTGDGQFDGHLRVGTATDAAAAGDFSAGLTGAARMFFDQSNGGNQLLLLFNNADSTTFTNCGLGIAGSTTTGKIWMGYDESVGSGYGLIGCVKEGVDHTNLILQPIAGKVGIGNKFPSATLYVDQQNSSSTIIPLALDQADVSEPMIEFVTTIGTGNAIEAIASKTLTTTHFIKIKIPGSLTRYIPCGTIA